MKHPGGRPPFKPTEQQRGNVRGLVAFGHTLEEIRSFITGPDGKPIAVSCLRKHFKAELADGLVKANAEVANGLFKNAKNGNVAAQIFWLKTRARWKETQQHEVTGKDGGPIETQAPIVGLAALRDVLEANANRNKG